ncbi:MAG TPA: tetratricopeptide repeat protein [Terriglobales bacterium]|nr:tetratricopeptide repeat protein [Terriglobales bacterium]
MKKISKAERLRSTPPRQSWRERLHQSRIPLVVCGLALAIYSRSLFCGFIRDDVPQIVNNPQVQSWQYFPRLLGSHLWSQFGPSWTVLFYRPLFSVWMLLVHTVGGLSPWVWHLSNVLLHVAATYLVFRLCRRLMGSDIGAGVAAAVFAVHPIHVDAVTWVSASCELLFTLFTLGSILVLLGDNTAAERPKVLASAALYGAGLFAKETGVALVLILIVVAWVRLRGQVKGGLAKRLWLAGSPYIAATGIYVLARWFVMHQVGTEAGEHSWAEVIFSGSSVMLFYLKKLIIPLGLSGSYMNPLTASPTASFSLELVAIAAGVAIVSWFAFRYSPVLGLAAALMLAPILPALAVVRIYPQGDMTHDRYLYLASVGLCLMVGMLVAKLWSMRKPAKLAVVAVMGVVLAALSAVTFAQQKFYHDNFAFYRRVIETNPSDGMAYGLLGNEYMDQGNTDLALDLFRKAHQISPENPKVSLFLARGLVAEKQYLESEAVLNQMLQNPGLDTRKKNGALVSLANVEISLGKLESGQQLLQRVQESDPRFPELHWALGLLFQREGLLAQAQAEYEKEFEITGDELAEKQSLTVAKMRMRSLRSSLLEHPSETRSIK